MFKFKIVNATKFVFVVAVMVFLSTNLLKSQSPSQIKMAKIFSCEFEVFGIVQGINHLKFKNNYICFLITVKSSLLGVFFRKVLFFLDTFCLYFSCFLPIFSTLKNKPIH